jgi:DNA-directed RNA polymerase subunit RPC12/RpoP
MSVLIGAGCPSCGANLKVTPDLERAFCEHCGRNYLITKEKDDKKGESIECPMCRGKGLTRCYGADCEEVKTNLRTYELFLESCTGDGKCHVFCHPEKLGISANYCSHGKCAWCNGTGKNLLGNCEFCHGTGDCRFCRGSGKCTLCNGDGVITCKACKGKGYNNYLDDESLFVKPIKEVILK